MSEVQHPVVQAIAIVQREQSRPIRVFEEPTHLFWPGPFGQCMRLLIHSVDAETGRPTVSICRALWDDEVHAEGEAFN